MHVRTLLFAFILLFAFSLTAQKPAKRVKERAAERTEAKTNQRVDQKIDKGIDKIFNGIDGLFGKKKTVKKDSSASGPKTVDEGGILANDGDAYADEDEAKHAMENLLGIGEAEPFEAYENPITFSILMEIAETKKNGKVNESTMRLGATTNRFAMVTSDESGQSSQIIFSTEDGKTTTISTDKKGEKSGFRMRMPNFGKAIGEAMEESYDYITMTETGERRTIDGYDCEKIIVEDSKHNTTTVSWVTKDIELSTKDVFGGMASMMGGGKQVASMPDQPIPGFPIETTTDDGKTITTMHFANIKFDADIDRTLFDTSGVDIQEMGF